MLTKSKSLYQVKLIIDCLPKDEYKLIPQETIDYLEKNLEYDEKIVIHPDIPLDDQNIDDKAYDMLEKISFISSLEIFFAIFKLFFDIVIIIF